MKPKVKSKSKLSSILAGPCRDQLLKMQEEEGAKFKDPVILQAINQAKLERDNKKNDQKNVPSTSSQSTSIQSADTSNSKYI